MWPELCGLDEHLHVRKLAHRFLCTIGLTRISVCISTYLLGKSLVVMSFTSEGLVLQCPSLEMQNCTDCSCPQRPSHTCPTIKADASDVCMWRNTSSFTKENKTKDLPSVSSTTLICTQKQDTGLDRSYPIIHHQTCPCHDIRIALPGHI